MFVVGESVDCVTVVFVLSAFPGWGDRRFVSAGGFVRSWFWVRGLGVVGAGGSDPVVNRRSLRWFRPQVRRTRPFIIAKRIVPFFTSSFARPFFSTQIISVVVMGPTFVPYVMKEVSVSAKGPPFVFQRRQFRYRRIVTISGRVFAIIVDFVLALFVVAMFPFRGVMQRFRVVVCGFFFSGPFWQERANSSGLECFPWGDSTPYGHANQDSLGAFLL